MLRVIVSIDVNGNDRIFLLTNRSDHVKKIIADYMLRWKIENFHKDAKQHLGLKGTGQEHGRHQEALVPCLPGPFPIEAWC
ncbi:MAG: hypothetical protein QXW73_03230 [Nitrososphaerales archaeon]